jgi:pimeloyl-ACP methyl ester carboxylesterase
VPPIALRRRGAGRLVALTVCCAFVLVPAVAQARAAAPLPTIVLVHGAWSRPADWNGVAPRLRDAGCPVVVPDDPLRSIPGDAAARSSARTASSASTRSSTRCHVA